MIIFLVSGFWYGANWTFIAWGAYHAFLFLPLFFLGKNCKYRNTVAEGKLLPSFKEILQMGTTFLLHEAYDRTKFNKYGDYIGHWMSNHHAILSETIS